MNFEIIGVIAIICMTAVGALAIKTILSNSKR